MAPRVIAEYLGAGGTAPAGPRAPTVPEPRSTGRVCASVVAIDEDASFGTREVAQTAVRGAPEDSPAVPYSCECRANSGAWREVTFDKDGNFRAPTRDCESGRCRWKVAKDARASRCCKGSVCDALGGGMTLNGKQHCCPDGGGVSVLKEILSEAG
mgnify:CR=1 FL=1